MPAESIKWGACSSCGGTERYTRRDGGVGDCVPCRKRKNRDYYLKNRAKVIAGTKRWRENNRALYNEYHRHSYWKDPEKFRERARLWDKTHRAQVQAYQRRLAAKKYAIVAAEKVGKACVRCGESDPACLDFHHPDPSQKLDTVSAMVTKRVPDHLLIAEMKKCVLVCANCHRKIHHASR